MHITKNINYNTLVWVLMVEREMGFRLEEQREEIIK